MKLIDLVNDVEVQGKSKYFIYDEKAERRVEVSYTKAKDKEITFMYCENDTLCIEVQN